MKKKSVTVTYIYQLPSFLDEQGIEWESVDDETIRIYYEHEAQLFTIGFMFGEWRHEINEY